MVIVTHNTALNASGRRPVRVLGIFAHPDDETICAGGTLAKYASAGAEVRVISLTQGRSRPDQGRERGDPGDPEISSREGTRRGRN